MQTFVYASQHKADTYVWLRRRDAFDVLPTTLHTLLGELRFVLEVDLQPERRLPTENTEQVIAHLHEQAWHLQLPPGQSDPALVETSVD